MDDTISRQTTKDMIKNHKSDFSTEKDYRTARACVNAVPPSQLGTNLAEVGTDCISRQAAIDRATKEHDFFRGAVTVSDKARRDELLNVMCWLGELPPAQPERIIHCKDCEWWTKQECSPQGRCALSGMYPTGGWFCGNARMREVTECLD